MATLFITDREVLKMTIRDLALRLKEAGAPIEFDRLGLHLKQEDIRCTDTISQYYNAAKRATVFSWRDLDNDGKDG